MVEHSAVASAPWGEGNQALSRHRVVPGSNPGGGTTFQSNSLKFFSLYLVEYKKACESTTTQILVGINMLGVAEALVFAKKAGVDVKKVHTAVAGGAAGSWQLTNNGAKLLVGDHEPGFKVKDYLKDLRIIMETSDSLKMPLVGTAIVQQMFKNLDAEGLRDKGTQAVVVAVEKLAKEKLA